MVHHPRMSFAKRVAQGHRRTRYAAATTATRSTYRHQPADRGASVTSADVARFSTELPGSLYELVMSVAAEWRRPLEGPVIVPLRRVVAEYRAAERQR
jgi:hypothetical protein